MKMSFQHLIKGEFILHQIETPFRGFNLLQFITLNLRNCDLCWYMPLNYIFIHFPLQKNSFLRFVFLPYAGSSCLGAPWTFTHKKGEELIFFYIIYYLSCPLMSVEKSFKISTICLGIFDVAFHWCQLVLKKLLRPLTSNVDTCSNGMIKKYLVFVPCCIIFLQLKLEAAGYVLL